MKILFEIELLFKQSKKPNNISKYINLIKKCRKSSN